MNALASLAAVLALAAFVPVPAAKGIEWTDSFDSAFEAAAKDGRVVFVAVNMDGERANERMVKDVYRDKRIVELSQRSVNLIASADQHSSSGECSRFGCESCKSHQFVDVSVREKVLKGDPSGAVVAPQHVFLKGDGSVILSVPFEVSANELEWCFHEAFLSVDPGYAGKRSKKDRRPRRILMGAVLDLGGKGAPITRDEALEIISEHKKGGGGEEANAMLYRLVTADEPEARDYVVTVLRAGGGGGGGGRGGAGGAGGGRGGGSDKLRGDLIRWIGVASPSSYWELVAEFADSGTESVQREAVVALEQLAARDSLPMLQKALRRSADPTQEKNIVRALGTSARDDKKAKTAILRASIDKKSPLLRSNALIALGWLDADDEVDQRLREALLPATLGAKSKVQPDDVTEQERLAAIVAMGLSRGERWRTLLGEFCADEEQPEKLKSAAKLSLEVLDGEAYSKLADAMTEAGSDEIPRERLFPRTLRRGSRTE